MNLTKLKIVQQRPWPCFFGLLLVIFFPLCGFSQTRTVIGFGDSLTEGCWVDLNDQSSCGWVHQTGGYGYEEQLQSLLNQDEDGDVFVVHNFGRGGEQTFEGVDRIDSVLNESCNQGADYILLLEGTNDLLQGASGGNVKFHLGQMIDKSRARGVEPLLATITPDPNPEHEYKNIPLMNEYIRDLAVEKDVVLVDLYNALNPYWDAYTNPRGCYDDLLHPNPGGFNGIGEVWYGSLSDMPVQTTGSDGHSPSAVVYGSVDGSAGSLSGLVVEYGQDCVLTESVPAVIGSADASGRISVKATLQGLEPETMYCYRLISTRNGVLTHNGGTLSFTASPPALSWLLLLLHTP